MAQEQKPDRRRHPRFKVSLRTILTSFDDRPLSSPTRDVSVGGLCLEDEIPTRMLGSDCHVRILGPTPGESIGLHCHVFDDPQNPRRMQFIDPPEEALRLLLKWALKAGPPLGS
jgi:hypothetical protein